MRPIQPRGVRSRPEQVQFEVMVLKLKEMLAVAPEAMRGRYTNME